MAQSFWRKHSSVALVLAMAMAMAMVAAVAVVVVRTQDHKLPACRCWTSQAAASATMERELWRRLCKALSPPIPSATSCSREAPLLAPRCVGCVDANQTRRAEHRRSPRVQSSVPNLLDLLPKEKEDKEAWKMGKRWPVPRVKGKKPLPWN